VFLPHAFAYVFERANQAARNAGFVGTYGGRSGPKYLGMHEIDGTLDPTPRGSKPIQSYASPAWFGT
jgi:hypothetical protein